MKINEIFFSVQGEGPLIGIPMGFVRTAGCNLRCVWCDTKFAYEYGKEMELTEILAELRKFPTKYVCVTGGEPLIQPETNSLIEILLRYGFYVNLETNGSIDINRLVKHSNLMITMDIKCPSSKMESKMLFSNISVLRTQDVLKFVIQDETDYEYAKEVMSKYQLNSQVVFQPVFGVELKWLAEKVLKDDFGKFSFRILPQLHKLIWKQIP